MSRRHGRATIPFGKFKGRQLSQIDDGYLSWLSGTDLIRQSNWKWLRDSLRAELQHRGFRTEEDPIRFTTPILELTSRGDGCITEIEFALQDIHDRGFVPLRIICSPAAICQIAKISRLFT